MKLVEFNGRALLHLLEARTGILWVHNREAALLVAAGVFLRRLGFLKRVVWDQHELPGSSVLDKPLLRYIWGHLMQACDTVVVANSERRDLLRKRLPTFRLPLAVLENWADRRFMELPEESLPLPVSDWARGRPLLLLQGGAHPGRHFPEVVEAVIELVDTNVGIVVVGAHPELLAAKMRERWAGRFDDHVYFTGWIPQMGVAKFIDSAFASLVLYEPKSLNSLLCAPNRLYQAVARGTPVIVGSNPPMANLVAKRGVGVVLDGTGDSPADIARGVNTILSDPTPYQSAARHARTELLWENQEVEIGKIYGGPSMRRMPADPRACST